jgi:hypothetical protein
VTLSATSENKSGVARLIAILPFHRRFLRPPSTEAPSLHRNYPASSVLRASPPSQTARPVSRELPVDPHRDHRWDFPCCEWSTLLTCRRHYPGRSDGICSLVPFHQLRPSLEPGRVGSCITLFEACSAFTHVTACTLAKSPSDSLHQRLQQSRCLHCCSDCYRVERTSSRAGLPPLWTITFSRRTRIVSYSEVIQNIDLSYRRVIEQRRLGYQRALNSTQVSEIIDAGAYFARYIKGTDLIQVRRSGSNSRA